MDHVVQLLLDGAAHQKLLDVDALGGSHPEGARDDLLLDGEIPALVGQEDVRHLHAPRVAVSGGASVGVRARRE